MPLKLHASCQERMRESLAKALPMVRTKNQTFIDPETIDGILDAQSALPSNGAVRDRMVRLFDEHPLMEFILGELRLDLDNRFDYLRDGHPSLSELPGYEDAEATAERLVAEFESLPWEYRISVRLPDALTDILPPTIDEKILAPFLRIVRLTDHFRSEFPLVTESKGRNERMRGNSLLTIGDLPDWGDPPALYVQATSEGYIGSYGGTVAAHSAERHIRAFLGMGLAAGILESGHLPYPSPPPIRAYVHRRMPDGKWQPITRYDLDDAISKGFGRLRMNDLSGFLEPQHHPHWVGFQLLNISAAYAAGARAEQTLAAASWHFDSHTGGDSLLAFVQSMVVLEIVFGDKAISTEVGIGELIASRLAYLVGSTHDERENLMRDFRKIYQIRSQIVHAGKPRLGHGDRHLFNRLQRMGGKAIYKEITLLKSAMDKERATLPAQGSSANNLKS